MPSAIAETPWYDTPGAAFLLAMIVVVLTALGLIVAYRTFRITRIRRRITFSVSENTRMPSSRQGLEISYQGKQLADPYLSNIIISNDGPEIPLELFSEDEKGDKRGIEFDLNVLIHEALPPERKPVAAPQPRISASGSKFELKPELIAKKLIIKASFLTAGPVEKVTLTRNPFGNVKFIIRDNEFRLTLIFHPG